MIQKLDTHKSHETRDIHEEPVLRLSNRTRQGSGRTTPVFLNAPAAFTRRGVAVVALSECSLSDLPSRWPWMHNSARHLSMVSLLDQKRVEDQGALA
jgi:hypothetical protein